MHLLGKRARNKRWGAQLGGSSAGLYSDATCCAKTSILMLRIKEM